MKKRHRYWNRRKRSGKHGRESGLNLTGRKAAEAAIRQAGRNILISFRCCGSTTFSTHFAKPLRLILGRTCGTHSPGRQRLIKTTGTNELSVLLNEKDLNTLEGTLSKALKDEIASGVELKTDNSIPGGFRIGTRDGGAYYDFSAEAVADLFSAYLNPRISTLLDSAAKEL